MRNSKWLIVVALIVISFTGLATILWTDPGVPVDDATITLRYAQNIAQGRGFVYNAGERIQGTSTPLYTTLMAAVGLTPIDLVDAGHVIGILAGVASCIMVFLIGKVLSGYSAGLLAALLTGTSVHFAANVTSGMETPVYIFFILLTFYLFISEKDTLAIVVSGLCALTRLDGLAVGTSVLLGLYIRNRRIPWKEAGILALILAPWFLFATLYFGSPLPMSMIAKQHHVLTAGPFWMVRFLINSPFEAFLLPIIFFIGSIFVTRDDLKHSKLLSIRLLPIVVWLVLYVGAYSVVGIDMYDWYNVPPIPVIYLLTGLAVVWISSALGLQQTNLGRFITLAVCGLVLAYQLKYTYALASEFKHQAQTVEDTRIEVGQWLADNVPHDAVVATDGIGHIGYYSELKIIDLAGLITPYAIGKPYTATLEFFKPEYAVSVMRLDEGFDHPFKSPDFLSHYELVRIWPGSTEFYGPHVLFKRKSQ